MGNNEEREWPRRELAEANARNGDRRNASEDSLLHASSQRLGSIVSELPVNADNELQVRMYLPMTHHRIGGKIAVILNRNNMQLFSSNRFQSRNHLLQAIFHMQNQRFHWNIQEEQIKKKMTNFFYAPIKKKKHEKSIIIKNLIIFSWVDNV